MVEKHCIINCLDGNYTYAMLKTLFCKASWFFGWFFFFGLKQIIKHTTGQLVPTEK